MDGLDYKWTINAKIDKYSSRAITFEPNLRYIEASILNTDFIQNIKNGNIVQIEIEGKLNNSPKADVPGRFGFVSLMVEFL